MSYLPQYRSQKWAQMVKQLADYTLNPVRKILPPELPFDLSPLIIIFLLNLVKVLW